MAISYDPGARKWNVVYETENLGRLDQNLPTGEIPLTVYRWRAGVGGGRYVYGSSLIKPSNTDILSTATVYLDASYLTKPRTLSEEALQKIRDQGIQDIRLVYGGDNIVFPKTVATTANQYVANVETNKQNKEINDQRITIENENKTKNEAYRTVLSTVNSTKGGDYVQQREVIRNLQGIDSTLKNTLENYYKAYYSTEKIQPWDSGLGAKPPYGEFDPTYYKQQNPAAAQQWANAVANDDLDIIQRYGENNFYLSHYTNVGKPAGVRGNKAEGLAAAQSYVEKKPTDNDLQLVRNLQLGVDTESQVDRLLRVPEISAEWEKAKQGDSYWKSKGKEFFLDVNKPDEFAVLFRMSDRPEDKAIAFKYNINAGYGITELEDALNVAVGEKAIVDVKRFGALAQDVLKQTIDQMKKAKAKEQELAMFSGFGAFSEITGINKDLTNSILGDSGVGGVLSFMGGTKAEESLEKSLRKITGINNEVTYNWQQWFDNTLKQRYQNDLELGLTKEEAEERVQIQGQFAREFIDKYLVPRFNESRSMNEFVDYLDVKQSEQNPFQTQDIMNAAKLVADLKAQQYIDQLRKTPDRYFDSNFYFNPTGNKARESQYQDQASTVAADWEAAKKGDAYWASQAYRFGINVNDKDAFARMHFQVKGQGKGYDGADDILNASKVSDYIYSQILPALKEEALAQGTVFGQFLRPEEFADEMLRGLNPEDKETWDEVLKRYGLDSFGGTLEELKSYVIEAVRTGSAQEIREQIKYLNEKRQKPTQEILGVTYIQREEDYKPASKSTSDTQLYKIFQSAGFQGTEDEFYENFFPDLDRSEQTALTKAGKNEALKTTGLDFSDPFASLGTIESFFGEADIDEVPKKSSYFTIDEDEDIPYKTKSGQGFLDEFTSLFKGFG